MTWNELKATVARLHAAQIPGDVRAKDLDGVHCWTVNVFETELPPDYVISYQYGDQIGDGDTCDVWSWDVWTKH